MLPLKDGTGSGKLARVDANNDLHTFSVTETEGRRANQKGDAYNINTGLITLSSAAEAPVLYLKNNETRDLVIETIIMGTGASDGTAGEEIVITVVRNPTAGTTISNANAVDITTNRNFGSTNTLAVDAYKGATGETLTGGDDHILGFTQEGQRAVIPVNEIVPQGQAVGILVTPPPSNTDMRVYAALVAYLQDANAL